MNVSVLSSTHKLVLQNIRGERIKFHTSYLRCVGINKSKPFNFKTNVQIFELFKEAFTPF